MKSENILEFSDSASSWASDTSDPTDVLVALKTSLDPGVMCPFQKSSFARMAEVRKYQEKTIQQFGCGFILIYQCVNWIAPVDAICQWLSQFVICE